MAAILDHCHDKDFLSSPFPSQSQKATFLPKLVLLDLITLKFLLKQDLVQRPLPPSQPSYPGSSLLSTQTTPHLCGVTTFPSLQLYYDTFLPCYLRESYLPDYDLSHGINIESFPDFPRWRHALSSNHKLQKHPQTENCQNKSGTLIA